MKDGLLFVDKEEGVSSRRLDNLAQKKFSEKKVGHLGTLDPFASGLLILALGKATKFLPYLDDGKKEYVASLKLGYSSSTGDPTGEIEGNGEYPDITLENIKETLKSFLGKSSQIPPMQSAIKVNGTALYKLAHKGEEIERKPREIEIYEIELKSFEEGVISFRAIVSKGTYIRTLGEDIAKALGTIGYLLSLRRTAVGSYKLDMAKHLDDMEDDDILDPTPYVYLPHFEVNEAEAKRIQNGMKLFLNKNEDKLLLINKGQSLAVYKKEGKYYVSERGLF